MKSQTRLGFWILLVCLLVGSSTASAQLAAAPPGPTPPYQRTVIVPATANASANGSALLDALANLNPAPDAQNRWLIQLEPGIYYVGKKPVPMMEYVDIEGSGIEQTVIRGSVQPPPPSRLGGLVEGADNAEIRWLTIHCQSTFQVASCQGMSMHTASPRLTHLRIFVEGGGSANHWGIRTFDSAPRLESVEIVVAPLGGNDTYGIVYGGFSTPDIRNSSISVANGGANNSGIVLKEAHLDGTVRDTTVTANGGFRAYGIQYISASTNDTLHLEDVEIVATQGSNASIAIGESPFGPMDLKIRGGRLVGDTDGINLWEGTVELLHTEVVASQYFVRAADADIGFTRFEGTGTVSAGGECGAILDGFTFSPDTCP